MAPPEALSAGGTVSLPGRLVAGRHDDAGGVMP
jgi:hypothetical protein